MSKTLEFCNLVERKYKQMNIFDRLSLTEGEIKALVGEVRSYLFEKYMQGIDEEDQEYMDQLIDDLDFVERQEIERIKNRIETVNQYLRRNDMTIYPFFCLKCHNLIFKHFKQPDHSCPWCGNDDGHSIRREIR